MSTSGSDQDYFLVSAPGTSADDLAAIAARRPDLRPQILAHPNIYPELAGWIRQQQGPQLAGPAHYPDAQQPLNPSPRKRRFLPWMAAATAIVVVGAFIGAYFLFLSPHKRESLDATAFNQVPRTARLVDLKTVGDEMKLTPIGDQRQPYLRHQNQNLMALRGTTGYVIVAVDSSARTPYPLWALPICVKPSKCSLSGSVLSCRGGQTYNLASGTPVVQNTAQPAGWDETPGGDPGAEAELNEEAADTDTSAGGGMSAGAEIPAELSDEAPAILLTAGTSEDVPYRVVGGELLAPDDSVIASGLGEGPVWALPAGGDNWVVSDGLSLLGADRDEASWQRSLPEGSAALNEFAEEGPPSWKLAGKVLLVGTPDAILALDTETGSEVWKVEGQVTSWSADNANLLLTTKDGLAVLPFPTAEDAAGADVGGGQSGEQSGEDASVIWVGDTDEVEAPTFADFQNADLALPAACGAGSPVRFTDGLATDEFDSSQAVAMTAFTQIIIGGQLFSVLALDCDAYGESAPPILAVYDADKQLTTEIDYLRDVDIPNPKLQELFGVGTAVDVVLAASEERACPECTPGQPTLVTLLWNGERFETARVADAEDVTPPSGNRQVLEKPTRPALTAAEIANATLFFPAGVLNPTRSSGPNPDETLAFSNYSSSRAHLIPESIREITAGGLSYTLVAIRYWEPGGSGERGENLCALNPDGVAVACTNGPNPSKWTSYLIREVTVDGNDVSYLAAVGSAGEYQGWVTESFDGNQFIPVTWEIRDVLGNVGELRDAG